MLIDPLTKLDGVGLQTALYITWPGLIAASKMSRYAATTSSPLMFPSIYFRRHPLLCGEYSSLETEQTAAGAEEDADIMECPVLAVYSVHCAVHCVYTIHCNVHIVLYTVYSVQDNVHCVSSATMPVLGMPSLLFITKLICSISGFIK